MWLKLSFAEVKHDKRKAEMAIKQYEELMKDNAALEKVSCHIVVLATSLHRPL